MKLNLKKVFLLVSLISVNAFAQVTADPSRPTIFSDSTNVQTVPMQNSSGKQVLETVVVPGDDAVIKWGGGIISGTGIKYFALSNKITATSLRVEYAPGTVSQASGGKSLGKSAGNTKDASGVRPVCTVDTCGSDCGDDDGQQPCEGDNAVHKKS